MDIWMVLGTRLRVHRVSTQIPSFGKIKVWSPCQESLEKWVKEQARSI
jgi:hypothetical protein